MSAQSKLGEVFSTTLTALSVIAGVAIALSWAHLYGQFWMFGLNKMGYASASDLLTTTLPALGISIVFGLISLAFEPELLKVFSIRTASRDGVARTAKRTGWRTLIIPIVLIASSAFLPFTWVGMLLVLWLLFQMLDKFSGWLRARTDDLGLTRLSITIFFIGIAMGFFFAVGVADAGFNLRLKQKDVRIYYQDRTEEAKVLWSGSTVLIVRLDPRIIRVIPLSQVQAIDYFGHLQTRPWGYWLWEYLTRSQPVPERR